MSALAKAARSATTLATARWIALAAFLLYAATGGGRITGSDELTMFQLSQALLRGGIAVPEGATLQGRDGRFYSKNVAGQAVLALPLVAVSEGVARAGGFTPARAALVARFGASFFNAIVTALLLAAFYLVTRRLGVGARAALAATALLGFTTPLWVSAKSFAAEPLEALGLLLALGGAAAAGAGGAQALPGERRAAWIAALGAFLAIATKPSMLPLALLALLPLGRARLQRWAIPLAGVGLALLVHFAYNTMRFGNPLQSGYGSQQSLSAFNTPIAVGLYGLLLSSGKGLAWFAPAVWLFPWGVAEMLRARAHSDAPRHGRAARAAAIGMMGVCAWTLVQFATFQHWAGDGSFGPRYLVPVLPLAFLAVAFALERASRARRRIAWALALAGLLVQIGGVSIYFGAQMRDAGDYPYTRALEDPHFMEASHFNPRYSPIAGHWRMLARNTAAHLRGDWPRIGASDAPADPRLGISTADQQQLQGALDYWWLYARYAGIPGLPLALAALALLMAGAWAAFRARAAADAEGRSA